MVQLQSHRGECWNHGKRVFLVTRYIILTIPLDTSHNLHIVSLLQWSKEVLHLV